MKRLLILILTVFIVAVIVLVYVNHFVFSISGWFSEAINLCRNQSVILKNQNGFKQLDTAKIASVMQSKPGYEVTTYGGGFMVSRFFDGDKYNLTFITSKTQNEEITTIEANNYQYLMNSNVQVSCTTPNYILEKNFFQMIDDLPISDEHNTELKNNVQVATNRNLSLF
ncbi:MAG TPA: hypothetical protein VK308_02500 [Pyrinomonadaceae bacterium]|jgi:hypothetical protein|nr:hypothetical protein [Pyrinomonadaceae bacterium]